MKLSYFCDIPEETVLSAILRGAGRQRPCLTACSSILAHMEKKYQVPGLHADFPDRTRIAMLRCLFAEERLRGMIDGKTSMPLIRCLSMESPSVVPSSVL